MYIVILLDYYFVIVFCSNIWKVERAARDQNVILHKNCTHVTYWCIKNQFFRCGDSYCLRFNIIVFLAVWSNKEYCWALKSKDIYLCLYHWQICIKMALAAGLSIRLMRDFVATLCLGVCIWLQKCTKVTKGAGWEGGQRQTRHIMTCRLSYSRKYGFIWWYKLENWTGKWMAIELKIYQQWLKCL